MSTYTFGIGCIATAIASAAGGGNKGDDGKILCADMEYVGF